MQNGDARRPQINADAERPQINADATLRELLDDAFVMVAGSQTQGKQKCFFAVVGVIE